MPIYRKLTAEEESVADAAQTPRRAINGLIVLLDPVEEAELRTEQAAAQFASDKAAALRAVDDALNGRIVQGYRHGDAVFPADGVTLNEAKDISDGIQATGASDPVAWPDKDGTVITFAAEDFVTFTAAARMYAASHAAVARAKRSAIAACTDQAALDAHLAENPPDQGWP